MLDECGRTPVAARRSIASLGSGLSAAGAACCLASALFSGAVGAAAEERHLPVESDERAATRPEETIRLAGDLEPGPFKVGFRKERLPLVWPDSPHERPSALDLYLWFPAVEGGAGDGADAGAKGGEARLTFADYYRAQETDGPSRETLRGWLRDDMTSPPELTEGLCDAVLDAVMWAHGSAQPAPGRHPLVLWSYRDSIPTMQGVLNEYLASHGYVVAFVWPVDQAPPLPWQGELTGDDKRAALELQVDLLDRALDSLTERSWVDEDRTAVLAWSYGGESAGALGRRRAVDLIVGIDSTLASGWVFRTLDDLAALDPSTISSPYVVLQHGRPRIDGDSSSAPALLGELPTGAWHVRFPRLSHGNFNLPGGMIPGVLGLEEVSRWAIGGDSARLGYEQISRHVLGFLDHYLRRSTDPPSLWSGSAPEGFVELHRHPPRPSEDAE